MPTGEAERVDIRRPSELNHWTFERSGTVSEGSGRPCERLRQRTMDTKWTT